MVFCLDLLWSDDALDNAFGANDESGAECAHIFASVHRFFAPYAEEFHQFVVCVGNQREGEGVFLNEFFVRCLRVNAYADYLIAGVEQGVIIVAQVASLGRAARCEVFGIEIKSYGLAGKVAALDLLAVFVETQNVGNVIAYVHHNLFV